MYNFIPATFSLKFLYARQKSVMIPMLINDYSVRSLNQSIDRKAADRVDDAAAVTHCALHLLIRPAALFLQVQSKQFPRVPVVEMTRTSFCLVSVEPS